MHNLSLFDILSSFLVTSPSNPREFRWPTEWSLLFAQFFTFVKFYSSHGLHHWWFFIGSFNLLSFFSLFCNTSCLLLQNQFCWTCVNHLSWLLFNLWCLWLFALDNILLNYFFSWTSISFLWWAYIELRSNVSPIWIFTKHISAFVSPTLTFLRRNCGLLFCFYYI